MAEQNGSGRKKRGRKPWGTRRRSGSSPARPQSGSPRAQSKANAKATEAGPNSAPQLSNEDEVSSLLSRTSKEVEQLLEAADDAAVKIREAARTERDEAGSGGDGDAEVSTLLTKTSKEVREVLESADDAAEKIREEARTEARQFLQESRRRTELVTQYQIDQVTAFTEQMLGEASAVQRQLELLRSSFERATAALDTKLAKEQPEVAASESAEPPSDVVPEEVDDGEARVQRRLRQRHRKHVSPEEPVEKISEGARLFALQQVMSGEDSEEIEARLKEDLGIDDPASILEWMGVQDSDS